MDENQGIKKSVSTIFSYITERLDYLEDLDEIKRKMITITNEQSFSFHNYHSSLKPHVKDDSHIFITDDWKRKRQLKLISSIELEKLENDCIKLKQEIDEIIYLLVKHSYSYNKYKITSDESVKKHIDEIKKELDK